MRFRKLFAVFVFPVVGLYFLFGLQTVHAAPAMVPALQTIITETVKTAPPSSWTLDTCLGSGSTIAFDINTPTEVQYSGLAKRCSTFEQRINLNPGSNPIASYTAIEFNIDNCSVSPSGGFFRYGASGNQPINACNTGSYLVYKSGSDYSDVTANYDYVFSVPSLDWNSEFGWKSDHFTYLPPDKTYDIHISDIYLVDGITTTLITDPVTQTLGVGFSCVVSYTETITNDSGITTTQTITYTIPDANLIKNNSFENTESVMGDLYPLDWYPVIGGAVDYGSMSAGPSSTELPRTGDRTIYNTNDYELWGSLDRVIPSGSYLAGVYARCATGLVDCDTNQLAMYVGSNYVSGDITKTIGSYRNYSATLSLGGGSPDIVLEIQKSGGYPYVFLDDPFLVPVDENGDLSCTSDLYPPDEFYTDPIGDIPGPIGSAGAVCYQCTTPNSLSSGAVSYWIAWLGCVIRNMFSCSLRVWLLIIGNWIRALVNQGVAWIAWWPNTLASAYGQLQTLSWFAARTGTNFFDLLIAVVELIGNLISSLADLAIGVVRLITSMIQLIPNALESPPIGFSFNGTEYGGEGGVLPFVAGDGPSNDKIVYLFFSGIALVDTQVFTNEYVNVGLFVLLGAASLLAIFWAIRQWAESITL